MTTVFLVRHAHSVFAPNETRPLSDQGVAAAELVAARLAGEPIAAIYSSPSRRTIDTVGPLAERLHLEITLVDDLREREVPPVPLAEFAPMIRAAWLDPESSPRGGESNVHAVARGTIVLQNVLMKHPESHVVVSTHGNLMALIMNGLDPAYDYDFWRSLTFPDAYRLSFDGDRFVHAERVWDAAR